MASPSFDSDAFDSGAFDTDAFDFSAGSSPAETEKLVSVTAIDVVTSTEARIDT